MLFGYLLSGLGLAISVIQSIDSRGVPVEHSRLSTSVTCDVFDKDCFSSASSCGLALARCKHPKTGEPGYLPCLQLRFPLCNLYCGDLPCAFFAPEVEVNDISRKAVGGSSLTLGVLTIGISFALRTKAEKVGRLIRIDEWRCLYEF